MVVSVTQDTNEPVDLSAEGDPKPESDEMPTMDQLSLDEVLSRRMHGAREIVDVDERTLELVVFELAGTLFGLPGSGIDEILADVAVFWVPGTPASMEGVMNVRGNIESVIAINDLLQLPMSDNLQLPGRRILLAHSEAMRSGIQVDRVFDVISLPRSRLSPAPESLPEHLRPYVSHLAEYGDRPLTVLDLERLFADYTAGLG